MSTTTQTFGFDLYTFAFKNAARGRSAQETATNKAYPKYDK
jgi:hypothetical protein